MPEFTTYMCGICGFVYSEEAGLPEHGIAAGTYWNALSDDWRCPECDAGKGDFEVIPE